MNRELVTLAFGVVLVSGVVVVSVWQNYPGRAQEAAIPPAGAPVPPDADPAPAPSVPPAAKPRVEEAKGAPPPAAPASLAPSRLEAAVVVVHKHRFGDCEGTLRAVPGTLTYSTSHKEDGFRLSFAEVEEFALDAEKKTLRIRRRGGRTWNFTTPGESGTALAAFHRDATRARR